MTAGAVQLRMSRPEDADAVLAFIRAMGFTPRDRVTWDGLKMRAALATRGDEIVGAIPIEPRPVKIAPDLTVNWAQQTCVAVHPDLRGGGIGSRLQALLRSSLPVGTQMMGVYREEPESAAYRWYLRNGFHRAITVVSWTMDLSSPSPPYSGERVGVRGLSAFESESPFDRHRPLTLALSPEYRGEGTRIAAQWGRARSCGCFVDQSHRSLLTWLGLHPYRSRYPFEIVQLENAYAVLGVGRLHSDLARADILDFIASDADAGDLLGRCIARARERGASPLRWALSEHDPLTSLARQRGMTPGWTFDLLLQPVDPHLAFDTTDWRYASIDFA